MPEPDPANPDLARFVTDKEGLKRDLFARIQARGKRATPALVEKELAALERAQAARSAIDAVRAAGGTAALFQCQPDRCGRRGQSHRPGARAQRPHRRPAARRRHGAQPLPARQGPARIRSGLRRQGRRLVQPAARHRRHAAGRHRGLQFHRRPLRQRRTSRLQLRQRSAVQDRIQLPHHPAGHARASPSTGRHGAASAWPRAAPSPR